MPYIHLHNGCPHWAIQFRKGLLQCILIYLQPLRCSCRRFGITHGLPRIRNTPCLNQLDQCVPVLSLSIFDDLFTNMIAAGEAGGILDTILKRLATYIEKSVKLKAQVKGAMVYPVAVLGIAGIVIAVTLFRLSYFGALLPNTFSAKADAPFESIWKNNIRYVKPDLLMWISSTLAALAACVLPGDRLRAAPARDSRCRPRRAASASLPQASPRRRQCRSRGRAAAPR